MKRALLIPLCLTVIANSDAFHSLFLPTRPWNSKSTKSALPMVVLQESTSNTVSGAGQVQVDMNVYNLKDMDEIAQEWTAVLSAATPMLPEGIYLSARNKQEIMADTVKVSFARGSGLGLELVELAGGRADGVGITVVENVLVGGAAEHSGILPGDSIIKIEVQKVTTGQWQSTQQQEATPQSSALNVEESNEMISVETECLGYDKTVEAIQSLPPLSDQTSNSIQETLVLTVKRLRRKPKVLLKLQYPPNMREDDITLELFAGENLRRAMLVRGVKLNDALSARFDSGGSGDCGAEGTCATCAVAIVSGQEIINPIGQQEGQIFVKHPRWRMSCRTIVGHGMKEGVLTVRVSPRQWNQ